MKLIHFIIILALLSVSQKMVVAQPEISIVDERSISITDITPGSPSHLAFNQKVSINFTYSVLTAGKGIRIFIRPMTSGKLTPNYAASGSPIYRMGKGKGTANFTVTSKNTTIDQLRVQVFNANRSRLIFEFYLPVNFTFTSYMDKMELKYIPKAIFKKPVRQTFVVPQKDTSEDKREVVKRIIKQDGTVEIHYSNGSVRWIEPTGRINAKIVTTESDTISTTFSFIQVQPIDPPSLPGFPASPAAEIWLKSLNAWIEYHGERLLNTIDNLLENEESFKNYQQFEQANCSSIYEKVSLRYTFLVRLKGFDTL